MISDDVYRARLEATITAVRYWVPSIADVADVVESETPEGWRLAVVPHVAGAASFEMLLARDQSWSLAIEGETFETLPLASLDLVLPLIEAVAAGRVDRIVTQTSATGLVVAVTMRADLGGGRTWEAAQEPAAVAGQVPHSNRVVYRYSFLPYRR